MAADGQFLALRVRGLGASAPIRRRSAPAPAPPGGPSRHGRLPHPGCQRHGPRCLRQPDADGALPWGSTPRKRPTSSSDWWTSQQRSWPGNRWNYAGRIDPAGRVPIRTPSGLPTTRGATSSTLDRALELAGYAGWRQAQADARRQGRYLGIGLSAFVGGRPELGPSRAMLFSGWRASEPSASKPRDA